jgi:hypothetical protein
LILTWATVRLSASPNPDGPPLSDIQIPALDPSGFWEVIEYGAGKGYHLVIEYVVTVTPAATGCE